MIENKKKVFERLKEEFRVMAEKKVERRRMQRVLDPDRLLKEKLCIEDRTRRDMEKRLAKEKHKEEVYTMKAERDATKADTLTLAMEAKPELMNLLDERCFTEETGFMNHNELYLQAHVSDKLVTKQFVK